MGGAHLINRHFIAPVYDVLANLTAFSAAVAAPALLHHWASTYLAALAVCCWLWVARRTLRAIRPKDPRLGRATLSATGSTSPFDFALDHPGGLGTGATPHC